MFYNIIMTSLKISRKQVWVIVDFAIGGFTVFINSMSHKVIEDSNDVILIFHCISRKQVWDTDSARATYNVFNEALNTLNCCISA